MPDPSGESSSPVSKPADLSRPGEPAHLHPAPRLHPASVHHHPRETSAPAAVPPADLHDLLEWVRRNGKAGAEPEKDAPKERTRSRLPKEQRKFHKFDPEHPHPEGLPPDQNDPSQVADFGPEDFPDGGGVYPASYPAGLTSEQLAHFRRQHQGTPDQYPWIPVGMAVLVFLLVAGAFLLGHFTLPRMFSSEAPATLYPGKPANDLENPTPLPVVATELIDQAITAEAAKEYPKAIHLLEQARREAGRVYGLDYRLARLYYQANDMPRVIPSLNRSINEGEEVAACLSFRGVLTNQIERTGQGPGDLEKATQLDPFDARHFFAWGEALRRAGKPELAALQLRRAVDRLQEPALLERYSLPLRLAQIEANQEEKFAPELAAALQRTPPAVDWLLTAAASEMQRGDFPAAAKFLARIRGMIGAEETARSLQDIFFTKFDREPALAAFYVVPSSPVAAPAPAAR